MGSTVEVLEENDMSSDIRISLLLMTGWIDMAHQHRRGTSRTRHS
jgi:hypothetical protein